MNASPIASSLLTTMSLFVLVHLSNGQVPINTDLGSSIVYFQDFNSLGNNQSADPDPEWTNNSTMEGWYVGDIAPPFYDKYEANDGTKSQSGLYSYGFNGEDDRSLGFQTISSHGDIVMAVLFNITGSSTINYITIKVASEQWRTSTCSGYQRIRIGYTTGNNLITDPSDLLGTSFTEVPEAVLVNADTTDYPSPGDIIALDGNDPINRDSLSITIPLTIVPGQEFLLRFYDEDRLCADAPIAIDNLEVTFSTDAPPNPSIRASSSLDAFEFIEQGIVEDIPDDSFIYNELTVQDSLDWVDITNAFFTKYDSIPTNPTLSTTLENFGYEYTQYSNYATGAEFHLLRRQHDGSNHWGTYVVLENAIKDCLIIQAPHPRKDTHTGSQAAAVFSHTQALGLMLAGIDRCASGTPTPCGGTTSICGVPDADYVTSDVAHYTNTVFDIASRSWTSIDTETRVIQLHGFAQGGGDPDFIISNGTNDDPDQLGYDFARLLGEQLDISYDEVVVHFDDYEVKHTGFRNIQGRYLNNYPEQICTSNTKPMVASGRFVHLEQYLGFRSDQSLYQVLSNSINSALDCSIILPVTLVSFTLTERNNAVHLDWTTSEEINHDRFEIERSPDGKLFHKISAVRTPSRTDHYKHYRFTDHHPMNGSNFYRLKQIDVDGAFEYLGINYLLFEGPQPRLELFPNPTSGDTFITGYVEPQRILDVSGQSMSFDFIHVNGRTTIRTGPFPPGLYFVYVNDNAYRFVKH